MSARRRVLPLPRLKDGLLKTRSLRWHTREVWPRGVALVGPKLGVGGAGDPADFCDAAGMSTVVGYARVSTDHQSLDAQRDALITAGCDPIFTDQTVSYT